MSENKYLPVIKLENARIKFKNFEGRQVKNNGRIINDEGKRNFHVILPEELALQLEDAGWNIKRWLPNPEEEPDRVEYSTKIMVNFDGARPPMIVMHTSKGSVEVTKDTAGLLDDAYIVSCDVAINQHPWESNTGSGINGYLRTMHAIIEEQDDFADKYATEEY